MPMPRFDLLNDVIFGSASPEERLRYVRAAFRGATIVLFCWAFGILAPLGLIGFAKSDAVDDKISSAVQPVQAQLGQITTQLALQDGVLKSIRIDQLAQKLRELKRTCCLAGADEQVTARMETEIERAQLEYIALTGGRYPLPRCEP